jgi:hypothetical protein
MRLAAAEGLRETVERVHGIYAMRCPLYRTLHNAIRLTSSYTLDAIPEGTGSSASPNLKNNQGS